MVENAGYDAIEIMVDHGLLKMVELYMKANLKDEDLKENLEKIGEVLEQNMKILTSFEKYKKEIDQVMYKNGTLTWGPIHQDKFWKENFKKFEEKDEAYAVERFDQVYGSIGDALSSGVLPKYFLEMKPLVPPPSKKIIQLVPTDAKMWFLVGDSNDGVYAEGDGDGDETMPISEMIEQKVGAVRRVAFHALVENQNGHRAVEPMIHLTVEDTETLREEYYEYNLEDLTGDACRRTMLASDWFDKAVVRLRGPLLGRNSFEYWTHVLEAEEEPEANGFVDG